MILGDNQRVHTDHARRVAGDAQPVRNENEIIYINRHESDDRNIDEY